MYRDNPLLLEPRYLTPSKSALRQDAREEDRRQEAAAEYGGAAGLEDNSQIFDIRVKEDTMMAKSNSRGGESHSRDNTRSPIASPDSPQNKTMDQKERRSRKPNILSSQSEGNFMPIDAQSV